MKTLLLEILYATAGSPAQCFIVTLSKVQIGALKDIVSKLSSSQKSSNVLFNNGIAFSSDALFEAVQERDIPMPDLRPEHIHFHDHQVIKNIEIVITKTDIFFTVDITHPLGIVKGNTTPVPIAELDNSDTYYTTPL